MGESRLATANGPLNGLTDCFFIRAVEFSIRPDKLLFRKRKIGTLPVTGIFLASRAVICDWPISAAALDATDADYASLNWTPLTAFLVSTAVNRR
jgi:hypothetical protein